MVNSAAYPSLERKPGGPDNWVEKAGGLPKYIERIAKHLHYEQGMTISHAIATAVNTVKRWARMGKVAKYGDPNHKNVTAKTAALAAKAVAEWEAKRAAGKINLSEAEFALIDLCDVNDDFAWGLMLMLDLTGAGAEPTQHAILSNMDIDALARRANAVVDPEARADARAAVLDLASTIAPRNARGRASDGRRSYAGQGKYKHGFIPVNQAAKEAKGKGSPIAVKRLNRIFGGNKAPDDPRKKTREVQSPAPIPSKVAKAKYEKDKAEKKVAATEKAVKRVESIGKRAAHLERQNTEAAKGRAGQRTAGGRKRDPHEVKIDEKSQPGSEGAKDIGFLRHTKIAASDNVVKLKDDSRQKEASKESRIPERARQNWDEIPETLKTVRNGRRYVVAEFGGKQYVTEWVGGVSEVKQTAANQRKVMSSLTSADAANMPTNDLRALINNPRTPPAVIRTARKALRAKGPE